MARTGREPHDVIEGESPCLTGAKPSDVAAKCTFGIVGGDWRYAELARLLARDGCAVQSCRIGGQGIAAAVSQGEAALEQALSADVVVLPLPLCKVPGLLNCAGQSLSIAQVLDILAQKAGRQLVLAGMVPADTAAAAAGLGIRLLDYYCREPFLVGNAAATADGAVCLTLEAARETLAGKRCLVLGFGRIGKVLCLRLRGAGAEVTAAARSSADRAWIRALGCRALDTAGLSRHLAGFDLVYNTVPALLLDRALLIELAAEKAGTDSSAVAGVSSGRDGTDVPSGRDGASVSSGDVSSGWDGAAMGVPLLVELASRPGFDRDSAERLGLRVLAANGLPGKMVPATAAAVLRDSIYEILAEERREGS